MTNSKKIMEIMEKNNGIITSSEVTNAGISRGSLKHLVDTGRIERAARGVYQTKNVWDDEMYHLQVRYKKGIFSGETALFLHDLTDRTPMQYQMTFPSSYNLTNVKHNKVKGNRVIPKLYEMGVVVVKTPAGNRVRAYSVERTLCDILRKQNDVDIQVVSEAFKRYVERKDKNIPLLSEYGKKLRVEGRLRAYLEVLL
ncbi:type IV toxin-antitoxin system AbiEi family antitoxin domain-containing protein [Proteiniclasticum sp. BAD-10]|uniref:Type IV toxin-antitoxin system AbiEi family antitoxin domain-containing protein n=1 Tax=Proteiniclasticum sediminis TaxID=2804028 RepID=A0A941CRQ7_9CLOT|nr:type IV toxin-antitoxin system AbiEi family antitoxin domain-containing protein [Proteiniclasticum sediminis]MBR0577007.1 type IV toxin-antitoxin system AbiEi family antitoxin domain-containing protein [Proteiniclasticum sediminis]